MRAVWVHRFSDIFDIMTPRIFAELNRIESMAQDVNSDHSDHSSRYRNRKIDLFTITKKRSWKCHVLLRWNTMKSSRTMYRIRDESRGN